MAAEGSREPGVQPQRIGPYEVLLTIGSGGMGTISLARATGGLIGVGGFARLVALKRPHSGLAADAEVMRRFLDEARLLAQVHHANVVGIHQIGSDGAGHFLVLDYVEGGTLDELVEHTQLRRKKLPPPVVLRIVGDVLAGLHAVHEASDAEGRPLRMLHRDVSVQNVLVGKDGVARIADFGIAKAVTSSTVTDKAYLQGRIAYMAPEYLRREAVDRRLDVYAMGVTMWTALVGEMPWPDASEAQIVHHVVHGGIPPLATAGVTVAPAIQQIVARACERDVAQRYATARDMLDAIEDLGRQTGWIASHAEVAAVVEDLLGGELRARRAALAGRLSSPDDRVVPSAPRAAPPRRRGALVFGALLLVAAGTAGLAWTLRSSANPSPAALGEATSRPAAVGADAPSASGGSATPPAGSLPASSETLAAPSLPPPVAATSATSSAAASAPLPPPGPGSGPRPLATTRPSVSPGALPTQITTANPYRK
jgi:serine/threonine protein kinase